MKNVFDDFCSRTDAASVLEDRLMETTKPKTGRRKEEGGKEDRKEGRKEKVGREDLKWWNICMIGIPERQNGANEIFEVIIAENFLKIVTDNKSYTGSYENINQMLVRTLS